MKDSTKAKLIVFLIVATIAFTVSTTFASYVNIDNTNSTKLISIENDSFTPEQIEEVPTYVPPVQNNTTWSDIEQDWNDTINDIIDYGNNTYNKYANGW